MKSKYLNIFLIFFVFLVSCSLDNREKDLDTLVSYMKELNRKDLAKIIEGSGFKAGIVYKDKNGNYQLLTYNSCYNGFVNAGYSREFSRQFCGYLIYTALTKVLEKRANKLEPEARALVEEYRSYLSKKEVNLKKLEDILNKVKNKAFYFISLFFVSLGFIVGIIVYKLVNIKKQEEELKRKIRKVDLDLKAYIREKEREAERIIIEATKKASEIIKNAQGKAKITEILAYSEGYNQGKEKHKKELKSLRNRLSAVRSIFKKHPELNDCFRNITGWDFEKWLKER